MKRRVWVATVVACVVAGVLAFVMWGVAAITGSEAWGLLGLTFAGFSLATGLTAWGLWEASWSDKVEPVDGPVDGEMP